MKNKEVKGFIALVVVTALSFGVIMGSRTLSQDMTGGGAAAGEAAAEEEYDVSGDENIREAVKMADGYVVTVSEKGYASDIVLKVSFASDKETISKVEVLEQNETETLGSKIAEPEFLDQFAGVKAPVYLPGMNLEENGGETAQTAENGRPESLQALEGAALADGTYEAKGEKDGNGFIDEVSVTVADGKITAVNWDAVMEDGSRKSVMSENGEYTMTEDGPTWAEQSKALAEALIENQSLSFLNPNEEGKTDAVSGVSISVGGFINLAQQCLDQAAGIESAPEAPQTEESGAQNGTEVDSVSGATKSSTAAVKAINHAYSFLKTVK